MGRFLDICEDPACGILNILELIYCCNSGCYFFHYSGTAIRQHFILTKDVSGPTETRVDLRTESVGSQLIFTMLRKMSHTWFNIDD